MKTELHVKQKTARYVNPQKKTSTTKTAVEIERDIGLN
jgi:hypothetical protein